MDEEQWMYDSIIYEEVDMNVENEEDVGVVLSLCALSATWNSDE